MKKKTIRALGLKPSRPPNPANLARRLRRIRTEIAMILDAVDTGIGNIEARPSEAAQPSSEQ